jgi:hypothetical protein
LRGFEPCSTYRWGGLWGGFPLIRVYLMQ